MYSLYIQCEVYALIHENHRHIPCSVSFEIITINCSGFDCVVCEQYIKL